MAIIIMLRMLNAKARFWCSGHLLQCSGKIVIQSEPQRFTVISGIFLEGRWGAGLVNGVHFTINLKIVALFSMYVSQ